MNGLLLGKQRKQKKKKKNHCENRLKRLTDNVIVFLVAQMHKCCGDYGSVIISVKR